MLASPFVGASNDALVLIRRAASKRPIFTGIEKSLPPQLSERDARLLRAFRQRFDRLVDAMARLSLELLCERIVADHDYDLAVLAQWDGRRRYANMRKLARLARSYEELRGADVEGFVRFVSEQESAGARELEAVAEEEGGDAVRLLTIHAAKGLEFKVVVVADAGRDRQPPAPDEILALSDGRFGFKGTSEYAEVKAARKSADDAERLRLYYVAMTRAIDRLIVSGAIDPEKPSERTTPIGWVLERLDAHGELAAAGRDPVELERGGARLLVRVDRPRDQVAGHGADGRFHGSGPGAVGAVHGVGERCAADRAAAARARADSAAAAASRCGVCRSRHSRRSSGVRTATTPSASSACVRSNRAAATAWARSTSATRCTGCSRRSTCARRRLWTSSASARGTRA